jgi:hypothetical protein
VSICAAYRAALLATCEKSVGTMIVDISRSFLLGRNVSEKA